MKLRRKGILPHPPIPLLLWSRADPEGKQPQTSWRAADRRPTSSQGISRTPFESRDAEAAQPQNCRTEPAMRHLSGGLHELQRHRARSHRSARNGRGVERRPSRQHPGCALLVQWRKGIHQGVLAMMFSLCCRAPFDRVVNPGYKPCSRRNTADRMEVFHVTSGEYSAYQ